MAARYDVEHRLAEGEQAVGHIQTYVQACQALGYQQPDLTAHPSQVGDWYASEAGLDLRVLDGDVGELRAAVTAIEEALWIQRSQVAELAAAWRGSGAESARRFMQRHCDAAAELVAQVRAAAEHCAALRDDVWQTVDGKVATTVAVDDRQVAERSTWLSASHATGSPEAGVVIRQQVMPFVDNDIRNDWLAAMSSANAAVAASYDTAIHALTSARDVAFDVPGDLGPRWQPTPVERPVAEVAPATALPAGPLPTVPAAALAPSPPPAAPLLPADDMPPAVASPLDDPSGLSSGAGGLGGLGGMTGGLGGVLGSIVDSIGGLIGSLAGGLGGASGLEDDPLGIDDADDPLTDDRDEPDDAEVPVDAALPDASVVENASTPEDIAEPVPQPIPPPDAAPSVEQPPPVQQPPPAATTAADGSTPCEIAEDQLPQVGQ